MPAVCQIFLLISSTPPEASQSHDRLKPNHAIRAQEEKKTAACSGEHFVGPRAHPLAFIHHHLSLYLQSLGAVWRLVSVVCG